jgi:hypothetical protein
MVMTMRMLRRAALLAALTAWVPSARAQPADTRSDVEAAPADVPPAGDDFWEDLNYYASTYSAPGKKMARAPRPAEPPALNWSGNRNADGSASVSVKRAFTTPWDTKVGVDLGLAPPADSATLARRIVSGTAPAQSSGTAYVTTTAPSLDLPFGWDKAALEARVDPGQEQGKLGAVLDKSMPLGRRFSLNVQNGFSATGALVGASGSTIAGPLPITPVYATESTARLKFLPTGTSLFTGGTISTADDKWLQQVGVEQSLPGGVSINGVVRETTTGDADRSIIATFKRIW